jgi:hypothetical protein
MGLVSQQSAERSAARRKTSVPFENVSAVLDRGGDGLVGVARDL